MGENNEKAPILLITVVVLILASCGGTLSASSLIVIEKGYSSDDKEYWIKAYDPNNQTKEEAFNIVVQEEMAWSLLEEDKEYFAAYEKKAINLGF